jgi:glycosyltransferase involved in cell wall biosynthesis|tara:strand:+ start:13423 stop:14427 length:1005 start_codon:yes stop_codon:yes gene_type:complete
MKIIHIGNIANVSYLLCHGLTTEYNIDTMLAVKDEPINFPFIYNKNNNPYQVNFFVFKTQRDYFHLLSEALTADILQFHGRIKAKQLPLELLHPRKIRHFHGSDIRNQSWRKNILLKTGSSIVREKVLISTFDLMNSWNDAQYLPNPVDPIFFKAFSSQDDYSIFLPARFENQTKGIHFAFEAWDRIKRLNKEVKLKVICWGEDLEYYRVKYKNDERIKWMQTLNQSKMAIEMANSSIIWGQFKIMSLVGLIELEAMALAKVVMMKFDEPKIAEYRPPICNVNTPEDLAQKTLQLLGDEGHRNRIGQQAQEWVKKNHSLKNVTRKLVDIYNNLI